jgi:hypothetical protein
MASHNIQGVETFYGNATLYVADRNQVTTFHEYNYTFTSLRPKTWKDYTVQNEVIVAFWEYLSKKEALQILRNVVKKIEVEMKQERR